MKLFGCSFFVRGEHFAREADFTHRLVRREMERPRALAAAHDRQLGLGEEDEKVRPGGGQLDIDYAIGHCDDVVDRTQRILQRIASPDEIRIDRDQDIVGTRMAERWRQLAANASSAPVQVRSRHRKAVAEAAHY